LEKIEKEVANYKQGYGQIILLYHVSYFINQSRDINIKPQIGVKNIKCNYFTPKARSIKHCREMIN